MEVALTTLAAAVIHTGETPSDRLFRSAVIASAGDLLMLQYYVGLLAIDWRDVIVAGEYDVLDGRLACLRDFNTPDPADITSAIR